MSPGLVLQLDNDTPFEKEILLWRFMESLNTSSLMPEEQREAVGVFAQMLVSQRSFNYCETALFLRAVRAVIRARYGDAFLAELNQQFQNPEVDNPQLRLN